MSWITAGGVLMVTLLLAGVPALYIKAGALTAWVGNKEAPPKESAGLQLDLLTRARTTGGFPHRS